MNQDQDIKFKADFVSVLNMLCKQRGRGIDSAIAKAIGCSPAHISRIKGGRAGSEATRRKIASFFGYRYDDFLALGQGKFDADQPAPIADQPAASNHDLLTELLSVMKSIDKKLDRLSKLEIIEKKIDKISRDNMPKETQKKIVNR